MPRFRCTRRCYVETVPGNGRLYKVDDYFEGDKAPTRSFEGYVEPKAQPAMQGRQEQMQGKK